MQQRRRQLALVTGLAFVLGVTTGTAPVGAVTLTCGQTITTNTTLTADVGPCPDNGIIVGADNITLDLGGHHVFGTSAVGDGAGIYLQGRTGVTVRNGTVSAFDGGVVVNLGSRNTITQITAVDNVGELSASNATDFGDGILVVSSSDNRIVVNRALRNGPFSGITLLGNSDRNLVQGNAMDFNNLPSARPGTPADPNVQQDDGLRLETVTAGATPDANRIIGNAVRNNGLDGIAVFPLAKDNLIEGNTVDGNGSLGNVRPGDGIHVFGRATGTIIRTNRVSANARHGIVLDSFDPVTFPVPGNNRVERNVSAQNGQSPGGFPAFDLADLNRNCDANTWVANIFRTKNDPGTDCIH